MKEHRRTSAEGVRARLEHERAARREAEDLADAAARELLATIDELKRRNDDLELAHGVRAEVLSISWHEVRTPLTVLRGFAELLSTRWEQLPDADRRRYADAIAQRAHGLALRLDELSWASQLERGDVDVGPVRLHVATVLGEAEAAVPELRGIERTTDCPDDVFAYADPRHVRTILRIFLANAVVHGEPPINVGVVRGDAVEIRVSDSGPGIAATGVEEMFQLFTQADRSMTRERSGAGLGLAVARGLATVTGAEVSYEDAPGGGACFVLWLPANRPSVG